MTSPLSRYVILIADKSKASRAILLKTIEALVNAECVQAGTTDEAQEILSTRNVILAFVEKGLVIEKDMLLFNEANQSENPTPIIITGSEFKQRTPDYFISQGACYVMEKPFLLSTVQECVNKFIKN